MAGTQFANNQKYAHNPPNLLNNASPKSMAMYPARDRQIPLQKMVVMFEDETVVSMEVNANICSVNVISLALEKRGWSSSMTHLFNLCIKDNDPLSDSTSITILEDDRKPIPSLPQFVQHLKLVNPQFIITYKQQ
eukprot:UN04962